MLYLLTFYFLKGYSYTFTFPKSVKRQELLRNIPSLRFPKRKYKTHSESNFLNILQGPAQKNDYILQE